MSQSKLDEAVASFKTAQLRLNGRDNETQAELDRLALLSPFQYGRERRAMAARFQLPAVLLDKEIEDRRRNLFPGIAHGSGQPLNLPKIEPADDPVNGDKVLTLVTEALERYVVLPPYAALATALWIFRAHADDCFDTNPRLALLSPEKRCGKTTLLELIAKLVPHALPTSNVTPSVIYRTIEAAHPTLLIDEVDSFTDTHEELRGILNSGHRRQTAQVIRNVGEAHEPRSFSTWCPMVLAAIGHLPDTLEDRSVIIPMRRRAPHESVRRLRWTGKAGQAVHAEFHALARGIARWVFDYHPRLMQAEPTVPELLNDRAADNWASLLAIAEVIGGEWPERARDAARALGSDIEESSASAGIRLLVDIQNLFREKEVDRFGSQQLCELLVELEERPWGQWSRGKPITPHRLAKLLRPYMIESRTIREGETTFKGYHADLFTDAFSRYLTPLNPLPPGENPLSNRNGVTTRTNTGDTPLFEKVTDPSCDVFENGTNPAPRAMCDGVTVQNAETQTEEVVVEEGPPCL